MGAFAALMGVKGEGGEFTVKDAVEVRVDGVRHSPRVLLRSALNLSQLKEKRPMLSRASLIL